MNLGLEGKAAIVTGAGKGIGRAVASALAEEGVRVVAADLDEKAANETASLIEAGGGSAVGRGLDVTKLESVRQLIRGVHQEFGQIDILVNNAGMATLSTIEAMSDDDWDLVMNVNLKGTFYCSREILPIFRQQQSGAVVNFASAVVKSGGMTPYGHYVAAKSGVWGFTKHLARESAPYGVRVNAVAPGTVDTDFIKLLPPEVRAATDKAIPLGRIATPEDIAPVVVFLVSDAARYITGELIDVNGGAIMD